MLTLNRCLFHLLVPLLISSAFGQDVRGVSTYLTSADRQSLIARDPVVQSWQPAQAAGSVPALTVDETSSFQTIKGFGFALTGGSAQLIHRMDPKARHQLLQELFTHSGTGIGVSYLRLTIGSSDMNQHVYTYDDRPDGQTDPELRHFSLGEDEDDVIPVMQEILHIAPHLRILASPWTAPSWMKTGNRPKAGSLKQQYFAAYGQYFVRYLEAMRKHGIPIAAITIQNEPLNANNTPSMIMQAGEEAAFLADALGPALRAAHLHPEVLIWDHNCDHPEYPLAILSDPKASRFVSGTAFHLYAGSASVMSIVHAAYPGEGIELTEQMVIDGPQGAIRPIAIPVERIVLAALRNWSQSALLWNLASDKNFGPHTGDGGCPICQGAITIDGDHVQRNIAYYAIAQFSKFVPPGSIRIQTTDVSGLLNTALLTPQGKIVLVVTNNNPDARSFTLQWHGKVVPETVPPGSVTTYVW